MPTPTPARRWIALPALALSLALVSGCAPSVDGLPSASAVLNTETMQIEFPIEAYSMSLEQRVLVDRANDVLLRDCFEEKGVDYPLPERKVSETPVDPSWRYGFWNADFVANKVDASAMPPAQIEEVSSEEWTDDQRDTYETCVFSWDPIDSIQPGAFSDDPQVNSIAVGSETASGQALASAEGRALVKEWQECVTEAGYEIDSSSALGIAIVTDGMSDDALHQSYVDEARCSDDLGTVQGLADLEARFQQKFIEENRDDLEGAKRETAAQIARAERILAES